MVKPYCYYDGKVQLVTKVGLPLNDLGILRGYGVFDFLRTYNSKPFHLKEHFARFKNSARLFDLKVPITEKECAAIIWSLRKKNKMTDASIRLVLTGGSSANGISLPQRPSFFILMEDLYEFPDSVFTKGAKIITFDYERLIPESKNINYITAVKLQKEKNKAKAVEILYTKDGYISEAATSNIFMVMGDTLVTTKEGILSGVTRNLVIKLARKDMKIEERPIKLSELLKADECFITATNKKITPIVKIDTHTIATGRPGEHTKKLLADFNKLIKNY